MEFLRFLLLVIPTVFAKLDGKLLELYSRDLEPVPGPIAWGHKFMGGGAGEGMQFLSPEGIFPNKQEVKTDALLPAYCDPPNPCPPGFTAADGCSEDFENTADFSRSYQSQQDCLCDEEHMFSCPPNHHRAGNGIQDEVSEFSEALNKLLEKASIDQHKPVVAKKFHDKRSSGIPRRKRAATGNTASVPKQHSHKQNPYLQGQKLNRVAKKKAT